MNKILFLLLLFASFLVAKDTNIQHLISQIRQAPQSQKRALINQLKLKLRDTNIHQRHKIFAKLQNGKNKNHTKNRQHQKFDRTNQHKRLRLHKKQNQNSTNATKHKGKKH